MNVTLLAFSSMKRIIDAVNVLISFVLIGFIALSLFRIAAYFLQTHPLV